MTYLQGQPDLDAITRNLIALDLAHLDTQRMRRLRTRAKRNRLTQRGA